MAADLLRSPSYLRPADTLKISQQAPAYLKSNAKGPLALPYPLSLIGGSESQEKWQTYENLIIACLKASDDENAFLTLKELTIRFGPDNERVQALRGLYQEALAKDDKELLEVLKSYDDVLAEKPTNMPIRKRRITLLRSMGKTTEAVKALTEVLDVSPIDAEVWAELADIYLTQGLYSQVIYCLEEVVLITPNAWNMHAKLGEVIVLTANATENVGEKLKLLSEAMRRFCRSIELCDDYLRGYYGLKLTTTRLVEILSKSSKVPTVASDIAGELAPPSLLAVKKLNELATDKLGEILRRTSAGEAGWDGYDPAELIAARELLDRDTQIIQR